MKVQVADWVRCEGFKTIGFVRRVARDGSWADVDWGAWRKRMKTSALIVETTIPIGDGWTVTDLSRKA